MKKVIVGVFLVLLLVCGCKGKNSDRIIGVKMLGEHSGDFNELFTEFNNLGVNTVVIQSKRLIENSELYERAHQHNIQVFINKRVFMNTEYTSNHQDVIAVTSDDRLATENWMTMICPSREEYRKIVINELTEYARKYKPVGISLDFIRHFVFWENAMTDTKAEELPQCCFCDVCLEKFQNDTGIVLDQSLKTRTEKAEWVLKNHEDVFVEWKSSLITSMVKEVSESIKAIDPEIKLAIWTVPWKQNEYDNGIKRVAGQDLAALAEYVDIFGPMAYHSLMKRDASWIQELTNDIKAVTGKPVIPGIQMGLIVRLKEREFSDEEFKKTLTYALHDKSDGFFIFSNQWESFSVDFAKKDMLTKAVK